MHKYAQLITTFNIASPYSLSQQYMLQELEDRLHRIEQGGIESVFESDCVELLIPKQAPPSMQSSGQKSMNSMTTYLAKNIFFIMFTMLA